VMSKLTPSCASAALLLKQYIQQEQQGERQLLNWQLRQQILQKQTQMTIQRRQQQCWWHQNADSVDVNIWLTATVTAQQKKGLPDKVIAAVAEAFHNVGLIVLGTNHDDWHHCVRHRLAQLRAELVPCMHNTLPLLIRHTNSLDTSTRPA